MISVYIATSIDGYIATADGDVDWLHELPVPEGDDFGFSDFMADIDALVMGRHSYEKVRSFGVWPYPCPTFVLTSQDMAIPPDLEGRVEFIAGAPEAVTTKLAARGLHRLYIDGGQVIQSFLAEDLVEQMVITRIPVVLGGGIPLFGELGDPLWFRHEGTEICANALVKSRYRRVRS